VDAITTVYVHIYRLLKDESTTDLSAALLCGISNILGLTPQ